MIERNKLTAAATNLTKCLHHKHIEQPKHFFLSLTCHEDQQLLPHGNSEGGHYFFVVSGGGLFKS